MHKPLRALSIAVFLASLFADMHAAAQTEKVLASFELNGKYGSAPVSSLTFDTTGNLYGTTSDGGAYTYGTVFELTPATAGGWTERVLHSFDYNGEEYDGQNPGAGLVFDGSGNLYGTTFDGGLDSVGGTVFQLTPNPSGGWTEGLLHNFGNGTDGTNPSSNLIFDAAGNFYGTTATGGRNNCGQNCGTVFELILQANGKWAEKVLHNFNGADGYELQAGLIFDAAGNLYGITTFGGAYGAGTAFELTPKPSGGWGEKILHSFNYSPTDGSSPIGGVIFDTAGNLYGTTYGGGAHGGGTVFELTPQPSGVWTKTLLHSFDGTDGGNPSASLIFDAAGNLYGTTLYGGANLCTFNQETLGCGVVFELSRKVGGGGWKEKVLHNFIDDGTDGFDPFSSLIFDVSGNLYGTTIGGGNGGGTVYEVTP